MLTQPKQAGLGEVVAAKPSAAKHVMPKAPCQPPQRASSCSRLASGGTRYHSGARL